MKRYVACTSWVVVGVLACLARPLAGDESAVPGSPNRSGPTRGGILESLRDPAARTASAQRPNGSRTEPGTVARNAHPRNSHPRSQATQPALANPKFTGRTRTARPTTGVPTTGTRNMTVKAHETNGWRSAPSTTSAHHPMAMPIPSYVGASSATPTFSSPPVPHRQPAFAGRLPVSQEVLPIEFEEDQPAIEDMQVADEEDLQLNDSNPEEYPEEGIYLGAAPADANQVQAEAMPAGRPRAAAPVGEPTPAAGAPVPGAARVQQEGSGYSSVDQTVGNYPQNYGHQQGYTLTSMLGPDYDEQRRQMCEQQFCEQMWNCAGGRCLSWRDRVLRNWRRSYETNWGGACGGSGCNPPILVSALCEPILYPRANFGWLVGMGPGCGGAGCGSVGCGSVGCGSCRNAGCGNCGLRFGCRCGALQPAAPCADGTACCDVGAANRFWAGFCADDHACTSCGGGGCTSCQDGIADPTGSFPAAGCTNGGCTSPTGCSAGGCTAPLPNMVSDHTIFAPPAMRTTPAGCPSGACGQ